MKDFRDTATSFENDFGSSEEGRLIKALDNVLRKPFDEEYGIRVDNFYRRHGDTMHRRISTHPLYGLAILRIASIIGDQDLYDQTLQHCLQNYLPWQIFEDGDETHQTVTRKRWLMDAMGKYGSNCKIKLNEKINMYTDLAIDGRDPSAHNDIKRIGIFRQELRADCLTAMERISKIFPDTAYIAVSLVVLTEDLKERERLAFEMLERFDENETLARITDDINFGQPGYRHHRNHPLYIYV